MIGSTSQAPARRRALPVLLGLTMLVVLGTAQPAAARLTAAERERVGRGDVLTFSLPPPKGGGVRIGKAVGIVEGSTEAIVHTLMDVARYKFYLPRIKGSRFVRRADQHTVFGVAETSLPWPARDAWCYFRLTYKALGKRVFELRWTMRNGTMKRYQGYARLEPWDERGDKAIMTYKTLFEPKTAAPDSVLSKGVRKAAEMFLHRTRMRVKALVRFKKLPADLQQRYR